MPRYGKTIFLSNILARQYQTIRGKSFTWLFCLGRKLKIQYSQEVAKNADNDISYVTRVRPIEKWLSSA